MARLTQEQRIEIVHTQVPKNYAAFCQKPLRWYMGAALVNAVWLVDPTGGSSLTLGTMLSLIIQSAYLIHFRSQVIVPFRLTYNYHEIGVILDTWVGLCSNLFMYPHEFFTSVRHWGGVECVGWCGIDWGEHFCGLSIPSMAIFHVNMPINLFILLNGW